MTNDLTIYFLSSFSFIKERVKVNLELLVQIFVLLTVPFNTLAALQIVYAKIDVQTDSSAILVDSNRDEVIDTNRRVEDYYVPIQLEPGNDIESAQTSPTLIFQGPGTLLVPILLYHRIDVSSIESQYYVSPEKFEEQMKLLHDWGYTTITTELLVQAITEGANLPQRPIILTFDDGHLNNYTIAYPIMKKYGFSGAIYIVGEYMGTPDYMNADQIKEMAQDGWEVGSHSMNHFDLTSLNTQQKQYEIVESRKFLETELGLPIQTFSYPFGIKDQTVINLAHSAGYIAAMGTGYTYNQGTSNLLALQRRGVNGTRDLNAFASVLPWQGDAVSSLIQDLVITLP